MKKNRNTSGIVKNIRGQALLGAPSLTSNVGSAVINRFEIDTSLTAIWTQLGQLFQQWRIKELDFHFVRTQPASNAGACGMAVMEDPDSTSPITTADVVNCRVSKLFTYGHTKEKVSLKYKPTGRGSKWLYTLDNITSDDRLEMPGDFIFLSVNFDQQISPGLLYVHYDIDFAGLVNSVVAMPAVIKTPPDIVTVSDEEIQALLAEKRGRAGLALKRRGG